MCAVSSGPLGPRGARSPGAALCAITVVVSALLGTGPSAAQPVRAHETAPLGQQPAPLGQVPHSRTPYGRVPRSGAERLADASLEVIRLGESVSRLGRAYEQGRRAAQTQREHTARLRAALRRERRTTAALHAMVGQVAREQYRTGGGLPYAMRGLTFQDPTALIEGHQLAERRELVLAARVRAALRESRSLAADTAAAKARWRTLEGRRDRLARERRRVEGSLRAARDRLQLLAYQASESGHCGGLPSAASSAAVLFGPVATPRGRWTGPVERFELSASFGGSGARWASTHTGQDFAVPVGTPVRSVGWGRVIGLTCGDGFGISLVVQHGRGAYSQYAHLAAVMAVPGQRVRPGQRIALSGDTGNSTGPHLHFEVRRTPYLGSGVDPLPWLRQRGVRLRGAGA